MDSRGQKLRERIVFLTMMKRRTGRKTRTALTVSLRMAGSIQPRSVN
jgi:hypothetical protein